MNTSEKSKIESFAEHVHDYLRTQEELGKLQALDKASSMFSSGMSGLIVFSVFLLVILFLSIALSFFAASVFNSPSAGFGAVALLYLVIGITLAANREKWLKKPMADSIIKNYFKNSTHDTH